MNNTHTFWFLFNRTVYIVVTFPAYIDFHIEVLETGFLLLLTILIFRITDEKASEAQGHKRSQGLTVESSGPIRH